MHYVFMATPKDIMINCEMPSYLDAGKGMFSRIRGQQDQWAADEQWLEGLQGVDLPPVDTLMHSCLIQPIQEQVCNPDRLLMLDCQADILVVPLGQWLFCRVTFTMLA